MSGDSAVIFDVDGVLLDLTKAEEEAFFLAFERRYGVTGLSRDWNSYRIRNDQHIIAEILQTHGLPAEAQSGIADDYLGILSAGLESGAITSAAIPGTDKLLRALSNHALGIATANLLRAAEIRLKSQDLWTPVSQFAFGAEGLGHKREIVASAIAATGLPKHRIVYVGDNLNDVDAGLSNGVHFIGFSTDAARRQSLMTVGARHLSGNHAKTLELIRALLENSAA
jgi:phosphoglycolate phosphatase-like HAD superfamily hydrolase